MESRHYLPGSTVHRIADLQQTGGKMPGKSCYPDHSNDANAFEEDRRNAFKAGMNGHIAKPIHVEELFSLLAEMIK